MLIANEFEHGLNSGSNIKRRFSKEANIQYTHDSADDLVQNTEILSEIIKHHAEHQRPRLDILDDYYKGDNTTISELKRRKEDDKADHRAKHNYAKYVSNFMQGFLVGVPIAVNHKDESAQEKLDQINEVIEAAALNADLILDLSIYGRAYELLHRNQQDQTQVYVSSPLETFLIYDETIEQNIIAGVRYFQVNRNRKNAFKVELYTKDKVYHYITTNFGDYELQFDKEENHPFGDVPINEHSNNRFRQGDFENILDLIDLYDAAQSDTANYMTDLNDAMLKIIGDLDLESEEAKKMKDANILYLKTSQNVNGESGRAEADYIYKQYDVSGSEAYKGRVQTDIHKFTFTPDLNDENFSGVQSGEAMKYKLFGLEQIRINKERLFKRSLNRRYKLINNVMALAQEAREGEFEGLTFKFTPNLPKSTKEAVDMFNSLGGQLSEKTKLKTIPMIVEKPEEELEQLREERKETRPGQYMDMPPN
ncbi:phage portal protein [Virgibacillus pantothenticus]|uniref:phage portal protein n=1 Tax=Virgibacillus pantothenticus TaxID=1473 RepID=UPI001C24985F|nr:phage portal protein [Virgibacillus pantothenticus]MBU8567575.1 phage portal protein [Virgibacillus pantothenticus]MBU8601363.1 phage portal protein [Virgibacillus pantothenticus]MBU8636180.1 phage portal protein [Virgibacillus pantothenticus]MBU8643700.1 phage portal protein [Virgibacillus pantothenticus]MBU8648044.1 phage portal protein [Virgibacillus pantothenticus]